jgi:hypothetical protein
LNRVNWFYHLIKGDLPVYVRSLHETYGDVVRIGPDELSYISGQAVSFTPR